MTLQEAIDRYGLAGRQVRSTISADVVHLWNNSEIGVSLRVDRRANSYLEVTTKHGNAYTMYRRDLSLVGQGDLQVAIEMLQGGKFRELPGISVFIGDSSNELCLKAAG